MWNDRKDDYIGLYDKKIIEKYWMKEYNDKNKKIIMKSISQQNYQL